MHVTQLADPGSDPGDMVISISGSRPMSITPSARTRAPGGTSTRNVMAGGPHALAHPIGSNAFPDSPYLG